MDKGTCQAVPVALTAVCIMSWVVASFVPYFGTDVGLADSVHAQDQKPPFPDHQLHHLSWFIQVSDLHLSLFKDKSRGPDLRRFILEYVDQIKPEVVLVTGDLTHAKLPDNERSKQLDEEWQEYSDILKETQAASKQIWLDVRGNHDAFNVPSLDNKENMFRVYSQQGKHHQGIYMYEHKTSHETYRFIAVDACPDPGPKRPFNFFGILGQEKLKKLEALSSKSHQSANMTIWFGHYPSSIVWAPHPGFRSVLSSGAVYLCGHLHTLLGYVPKMYTRHATGNLELELGDWMDNRIFRVFAVDHGLFSFTDEVLGNWPIIMVTNPKNAKFIMPAHEPVGRMSRSSHIRVLVFSPARIVSVLIAIDGEVLGEATHQEGPLFVYPWNTSHYSSGLHQLRVHVTDADNRQRSIQQLFSLDRRSTSFEILPRFILMSNIYMFFQVLFALALMTVTLPLLYVRLYKDKPLGFIWNTRGGWFAVQINNVIKRCQMITRFNSLYWPLLVFHVYIALGPWFVGEIMTDVIGACFVFGIYVNGSFLPGTLTYLYGFLQIVTFNIPLTLYIGWLLERMTWPFHEPCQRTFSSQIFDTLPLFLLIIWQVYQVLYGFFLSYGRLAFVLCPLRTWAIGLALYLYAQAKHVSKQRK